MKVISAVLIVGAALFLAGCGAGKGPATTPEGTAKAVLAAVAKGDASALAGLYDYSDYARGQNPDWDNIPKGQRDLIVQKLIEEKAGALGPALTAMQADLKGAKLGKPEVSGDTATVPLEGGRGGPLHLIQRDGKWFLTE